MKFLKTNTATRVCVGPFLDATDGVTPETALTVTNCTCEMFVEADNGSGVTRTAITLTASGGSNDMVHITSDTAGYYDLELTAAQLNVVGRMTLSIIDTDVHCPVFHEYMILPANVFDSLVAGTDTLNADVTQISGSNVSTSTAQLGVNLVNISGSPVSTTSAQLGTNLVNIAGSAVSTSTAQLGVNLVNIAGEAVNTATAQIGSNVVSTAANAITGTSLDATAGAEIADAVWDEASSGHVTAGTFGVYNAATQGANVTQWSGSNVSAPSVSGVPKVDISHMAGSTLSTSTAQVGVNVVSMATDSVTNTALASSAVTEVVTGLLAGVVEGAYTVQDILKLMASIAAGKASGLDSNAPVYRNLGDTLNRISATTDASGNRTAVTLNLA